MQCLIYEASFWHYFQKIAKITLQQHWKEWPNVLWPYTFYENEMQRENPRLLVNPSNKSSQETQKIYSGKIHKSQENDWKPFNHSIALLEQIPNFSLDLGCCSLATWFTHLSGSFETSKLQPHLNKKFKQWLEEH